MEDEKEFKTLEKITKITIDIEFADGSTTFQNFTKVVGAVEWLETIGLNAGNDEDKEIAESPDDTEIEESEEEVGSEEEPDGYVEKTSEKGIM